MVSFTSKIIIFVLSQFFLLINTIQISEICQNEDLDKRCVLKSANLTSDFIFNFPKIDVFYTIIGDGIKLNCTYPCTKIHFNNTLNADTGMIYLA